MGLGEDLLDRAFVYIKWFVIIMIATVVAYAVFAFTVQYTVVEDVNEWGYTEEEEKELEKKCFGDGEFGTIYTPDMWVACMEGKMGG